MIKVKKIKLVYVLYTLMLFFCVVQNYDIAGIKPFHVLLAILMLYLIKSRKIKIPRSPAMLFVIYAVALSLLVSPIHGIKRLFFNYILGAMLIIASYNLVLRLSKDTISSIFQIAAIGVYAAVIANTFLQWDTMVYFFNNRWLGHPPIESLGSGGVNIDATWVAILCAAFMTNKRKWMYLLFSLVVSAAYNSRVGIMVDGVLIIVFLLQDRKRLNKGWPYFLVGAAAAFALFQSGYFERILGRFTEIGDETGSIHRLRMWELVFETVLSNPIGAGLGNAIAAINAFSSSLITDANLHNLFLEFFVALGVIGGIGYITLVVLLIRYVMRTRDLSPIPLMLVCYVVAGLVQFSGGESIMFILVGSFLAWKENKYYI